MIHEVIRKAYPNVKEIDGVTCKDWDGNLVEIDPAVYEQAEQAWLVEFKFNQLRSERNRLLSETDYLALADATLTDEMRAYRQALRDLPANTVDPANPAWPTKP
jgi:hypothetical protein